MFLFLPHFDVICDLLLNRRTATWNLFVKYMSSSNVCAFLEISSSPTLVETNGSPSPSDFVSVFSPAQLKFTLISYPWVCITRWCLFVLVMKPSDVKWDHLINPCVRHLASNFFLKRSRNNGYNVRSSQNGYKMYKFVSIRKYQNIWKLGKNTELCKKGWFWSNLHEFAFAMATSKMTDMPRSMYQDFRDRWMKSYWVSAPWSRSSFRKFEKPLRGWCTHH